MERPFTNYNSVHYNKVLTSYLVAIFPYSSLYYQPSLYVKSYKFLLPMPQIISDDLGQSFQLADDDYTTIRGRESLITNVATVESVANFLSTSLGPTGMDKILVDQDNRITVTNDGATILREMGPSKNPIFELIKQLGQSQDDEVGDGTTTIVILAAAVLKEAKSLIEKGVHPVKVAEGLGYALEEAKEHIRKISQPVSNLRAFMIKAAKTSLESKIASHGNLAEICADAVLAVADIERKDVDMERIYIQTQPGRNIGESRLVRGIVLKKEFSHMEMLRSKKGARIALLSCPFEPPKLKNKHSLLIKSAEEYKELQRYEKETFNEMVKALKKARADVVLCQWGFDDEANSLLMKAGIMAVRWVGGHELGLIAAHIGAKITARFELLTEECLSVADIGEESLFTDEEKVIVVESKSSASPETVTFVVRGSSEYVLEEAKRSVWDALCAARNILLDNSIVYGGGSVEISTYLYLSNISKSGLSVEVLECIKALSQALLEVPSVLARNSGLDPTSTVERLVEQQAATGDYTLGVDCFCSGENNMKSAEVFEATGSKISQLKMAVELAGMILKVGDVVKIGE